MLYNKNAAILFGLLSTLGACDGIPTRDLTAPDPEARALDAQSVSLFSAGNTWAGRRSGLPPARSSMAAGTINNVIYLVGGDDDVEPNRAIRNVDAYNVATNTWSPRHQLPGARSGLNGASVIAGKLYVAGGSQTKTLFVYDPRTNLWGKRASMPAPGSSGAQGVIGGRLYVYVGSFTPSNTFFRYNPTTNTWVTLASPPIQHVGGVGGVINGKFYLVGGEGGRGLFPHTTLNVYNPATNRWTTKAPMARDRRNAAGGVLNGKLYVAGGITDQGGELSALEVYDPATNTWTSKASMSAVRSYAASAVAGGRLFVIGGYTGSGLTTKVEAYTP